MYVYVYAHELAVDYKVYMEEDKKERWEGESRGEIERELNLIELNP